MKKILLDKIKEILQELNELLLKDKISENEKFYLLGELGILIELLKTKDDKKSINIFIDKIEFSNTTNSKEIIRELNELPNFIRQRK